MFVLQFCNVFFVLEDHWFRNKGVSKNRGTPKWMVKIMEHPIKMETSTKTYPQSGGCNDFVSSSGMSNPV